MPHSRLSVWRFIFSFWPLLLVFILAQWAVRTLANSASIAIPWWLSSIDLIVFIAVFSSAAVWVYKPLKQAPLWLKKSSRRSLQGLEQTIALLPERAFKGFFIAGLCCALYLIAVLSLGAAVSHVVLTPRMFAALALSLLYGVGVLAPSMGLAMTIAYSVSVRRELAKQGLFLHTLSNQHGYILRWNKVSRRPWVIFMITSALPASILAFFVYLILGTDTAFERQFILLQAGVLFIGLILAGAWLVHTVGKTLKQVMASFSDGLQRMREGQFDEPVAVLSDDEFGVLAKGMNTAFGGLREREELKHGLEIASEIHHVMLPVQAPKIPAYDILGFEQSCESVGGDYYDHIVLPDGRVWLVLADVAGKGYPAALTVANLRAMLHALAHLELAFEKAAEYINDTLCDTLTNGRFVTLFLAKLQPKSHTLLWLNAGHIPALLCRNGEIERLKASAPPMGLLPGLKFEVSHCKLEENDTLLVYSDGITEAREHESGALFGEARLSAWLKEHDKSDIRILSQQLQDELNDFGEVAADDDVTMLWLRRKAG
ncbi:MAG: SpoIIE family protein phosphatase [Mariprofundaceae bacterium]|nr:SpoIIE family protein phosphatase [Mariprofundaceae bacterium]